MVGASSTKMRRSSPLITIGKGRARHMEDEIGQHLNNLRMTKSVFIRGLKRQATISMIIHSTVFESRMVTSPSEAQPITLLLIYTWTP